MFKVIRYIKKNGIRRTIQVINEYKLDKAVNKLVALITKNIPLKDYIVIESHDDFDCNGGAFYDYLIEHGYNKKYKIIWMLKHKKPQNLPEMYMLLNYISLHLEKAIMRVWPNI